MKTNTKQNKTKQNEKEGLSISESYDILDSILAKEKKDHSISNYKIDFLTTQEFKVSIQVVALNMRILNKLNPVLVFHSTEENFDIELLIDFSILENLKESD